MAMGTRFQPLEEETESKTAKFSLFRSKVLYRTYMKLDLKLNLPHLLRAKRKPGIDPIRGIN